MFLTIGPDKQSVGHKIVNIFLSINFSIYVLSAQMNLPSPIEMVLLSTHNICFVLEIRKFILISYSYQNALSLF